MTEHDHRLNLETGTRLKRVYIAQLLQQLPTGELTLRTYHSKGTRLTNNCTLADKAGYRFAKRFLEALT